VFPKGDQLRDLEALIALVWRETQQVVVIRWRDWDFEVPVEY
jgi:hypothetical protein